MDALIPPGQPIPESSSPIPTNVIASSQPLFAKSRFLIERSAELCKEYDSIIEQASAIQRPTDLAQQWSDDTSMARKIIQAGNVTLSDDIETLLEYNDRQVKKKTVDPELEKNVQSMFEMGKDEDHGGEEVQIEGWGKAARGIQKGFNQLYKVIAEDVE